MTGAVILCRWVGDAMVPHGRFRRECDETFVIGQDYRMQVQEHRSQVSHNHYFASLQEAWSNLPEDQAQRFPTVEHLRKWALVQAGFRDERTFVCESKAQAVKLAAFVRPMDEYAVVTVSEAVVRVYTAQSQSKAAMGKKDFQRSKQAVLDVVAELIGTTPAALQSARAA